MVKYNKARKMKINKHLNHILILYLLGLLFQQSNCLQIHSKVESFSNNL